MRDDDDELRISLDFHFDGEEKKMRRRYLSFEILYLHSFIYYYLFSTSFIRTIKNLNVKLTRRKGILL